MYAYGTFWNGFQWWWIIPIAMMVLCFIMMSRRRGYMMGWHRSPHITESAREILDKRYALGEISKEEYELKKRDIGQ
jgi:putative membrane protein